MFGDPQLNQLLTLAEVQRGVRPVSGKKVIGEGVLFAGDQYVPRLQNAAQLAGDWFGQLWVMRGARVDSRDELGNGFLQSVQRTAQKITAEFVPHPTDVDT